MSNHNTISLPLRPNDHVDDQEILCLFCSDATPCEYALPEPLRGLRRRIGVHEKCLAPMRTAAPEDIAAAAKAVYEAWDEERSHVNKMLTLGRALFAAGVVVPRAERHGRTVEPAPSESYTLHDLVVGDHVRDKATKREGRVTELAAAGGVRISYPWGQPSIHWINVVSLERRVESWIPARIAEREQPLDTTAEVAPIRPDDQSDDAQLLRNFATYLGLWADGDDAAHSVGHIENMLRERMGQELPRDVYDEAAQALQPILTDAGNLRTCLGGLLVDGGITDRCLMRIERNVRRLADTLRTGGAKSTPAASSAEELRALSCDDRACAEAGYFHVHFSDKGVPEKKPTANPLPPLNEETMSKAWDAAMQLIRDSGEDPENLIRRAAKNIDEPRMTDETYNRLQLALEEANEMVCRHTMPFRWPDFQTRWGLRSAAEVLAQSNPSISNGQSPEVAPPECGMISRKADGSFWICARPKDHPQKWHACSRRAKVACARCDNTGRVSTESIIGDPEWEPCPVCPNAGYAQPESVDDRSTDAWRATQFLMIRDALQEDGTIPAADTVLVAIRSILRERKEQREK